MEHNHLTFYRLKSSNLNHDDTNLSFQTMMDLRNMDIVRPRHDLMQVIREGNTTVTVYIYERF